MGRGAPPKTSENSSSMSRRMRSKLAKRSRSDTARRLDASVCPSNERAVDREHLLVGLTEDEALAQVDAELLDVLELVVALDADRDDLDPELVGDLDEGAD